MINDYFLLESNEYICKVNQKHTSKLNRATTNNVAINGK